MCNEIKNAWEEAFKNITGEGGETGKQEIENFIKNFSDLVGGDSGIVALSQEFDNPVEKYTAVQKELSQRYGVIL